VREWRTIEKKVEVFVVIKNSCAEPSVVSSSIEPFLPFSQLVAFQSSSRNKDPIAVNLSSNSPARGGIDGGVTL
jgi:hypothetical protein